MNPAYLKTYRRHRLLFLLPLILAAVLALWTVAGSPKMYRANANLWSGAAGGSSNESLGAPPPAAQEQTMLNELLKTQYFQRNIARKSGLEDHLRQHETEGWGPGVLLTKLRGAPSLDDRIASALGAKRVTSLIQGPHVLRISYDAPSEALALQTLTALLGEYRKQRGILSRDALTAYKEQVSEATRALTDARRAISTYLQGHAGVSGSDPQLRLLVRAERNAATRLVDATEALGQASATVLSEASEQPTLRVVDPPHAGPPATSKMRSAVLALFGGVFAGALISCLGIVALTKTRRGVRAEPAAEELLDDLLPPVREEPRAEAPASRPVVPKSAPLQEAPPAAPDEESRRPAQERPRDLLERRAESQEAPRLSEPARVTPAPRPAEEAAAPEPPAAAVQAAPPPPPAPTVVAEADASPVATTVADRAVDRPVAAEDDAREAPLTAVAPPPVANEDEPSEPQESASPRSPMPHRTKRNRRWLRVREDTPEVVPEVEIVPKRRAGAE